MNKRRILLVEDNSDDEELIVRCLRKAGSGSLITVARDGAEALDYLFGAGTTTGERPDLIILDINLPKVNGFEVLEKIRGNARTAHISVVILSSSDMQRDISQAYALGASSYVRKPVEFRAFTDAVAALGHYWLELNLPRREGSG